MVSLINKMTAKAAVSRLIGEDWIIPTTWTGSSLPSDPKWEFPFILKASHGCNQNIVCFDRADYSRARNRAMKWIEKPYGLWLDEWAYRNVPRGFIVEPYLGDRASLPIDYKIYVFGGVSAFVQVHVDRSKDHRWTLFDRHWNQISKLREAPMPAPINLERMLKNAERIAKGFEFARIDFYEIAGVPKFGEVTFYPGSGLDPFDPPELDRVMGKIWLKAMHEGLAEADNPLSERKAA